MIDPRRAHSVLGLRRREVAVTPEGRFIAVVLMLTGIAVIGVFTATVVSFLFEEQQAQNPETLQILTRLERIEKKLESVQSN